MSKNNKEENKMEKVVSLCKRRGFVFRGSEIYGGLAGTWDYGPLGVKLKNNVLREWWKMFVDERSDMHGVDAAILMNEKVWEASGHTGAGFTDPIVICNNCRTSFRADHLYESLKLTPGEDFSARKDLNHDGSVDYDFSTSACPVCRKKEFGQPKNFNLMFETKVGAEGTTKSYLRPETAQGIFTNFKNVVDSMSPKIPFGIAQIGKAFRNEIAPREFLFRVREMEQMEIEYFVKEENWEEEFENWRVLLWEWVDHIGLSRERVKELEVPKEELAHYSKRTIDFEYDFPGKGYDELFGFAYRTDHDLKSHMEASGVDLRYVEPDGNKFLPHVLEPSMGLGRAITAILCEAYTEDEMGGETRAFLKLPVHLAPNRAMVSPLLKNKPELVAKAREVYNTLNTHAPNIAWDDNGNIGKRYRRQDEIGTPQCITIDFDTLEDDTVTVRDRDSGKQERVAVDNLINVLG